MTGWRFALGGPDATSGLTTGMGSVRRLLGGAAGGPGSPDGHQERAKAKTTAANQTRSPRMGTRAGIRRIPQPTNKARTQAVGSRRIRRPTIPAGARPRTSGRLGMDFSTVFVYTFVAGGIE